MGYGAKKPVNRGPRRGASKVLKLSTGVGPGFWCVARCGWVGGMNRASRTVWPLFVGLVCSVVLVGCVSSAPPGGKLPSLSGSSVVTPSVVVPVVPADVPLTGLNLLTPSEKPPVMPTAATRHDAAGAVAFAEFFIRTLDWGYATTSSAYMRHYFEPSCDRCAILAGTLDGAQHDNVHFVGQRMTITSATKESVSDAHQAEYATAVATSITASQAVDASGAVKNADAADPAHVESVFVAWERDHWSVVYLEGRNGR